MWPDRRGVPSKLSVSLTDVRWGVVGILHEEELGLVGDIATRGTQKHTWANRLPLTAPSTNFRTTSPLEARRLLLVVLSVLTWLGSSAERWPSTVPSARTISARPWVVPAEAAACLAATINNMEVSMLHGSIKQEEATNRVRGSAPS